MSAILKHIRSLKEKGKKGFAILIDPDAVPFEACPALADRINQAGIDIVLIGGSLLINDNIRKVIPELKRLVKVPVILFPGNLLQLSPEADAILFLSLISGRNPEMLIGNHVIAAPLLKQSGIEVLPTGYMLIDTGRTTAVHYMSNTQPIPYDKAEIAACTAMAGELLGLSLIYMDGGSGAEKTISTEMISAVAGSIDLPLIVGGGIRTRKQAEAILKAGADIIVVGNALEKDEQGQLFFELPELIATF
ncbi:MAG TPA: geranylgeranylglyceryl/heptaprenylglyceryl phosphate synthase [Bacteroidetes bacterium]|nr:geranylgeranylglyceryl/heptaprenylglyceryl phosphate synthase [Bacteroidota bacterium]